MTLLAFWLIALSVILHVSWNLISKASRPSAAFYIITSVAGTIAMLPFLFLAHIAWRELPLAFYVYFALTSLANLIYYCGLFMTYKRSDISMSYPLIRALPVVLVPLVTTVLGIGIHPSVPALFGMFTVFCGCLLMPLTRWADFRPGSYFTPVLGTIVVAALGTTGYTILDSLAFRLMLEHAAGTSFSVSGVYMFLCEGFIALGLTPFLFLRQERRLFADLAKMPLAPCVSGIFTVGASCLVLLATARVTNVSFVSAFRQMGLPLGVASGVLILKEKCSSARLVGIAIIVLGLMIVVFG